MRKFLYWLSGFLRVRFIRGKDDDIDTNYLERYFVFSRLGITIYLHRFVGSDPDPGIHHNHPFAWSYTIGLAGWYEEERYTDLYVWSSPLLMDPIILTGKRPRIVRSCMKAWRVRSICNAVHRVNLVPGSDCWTLFVHGPWCRPWGFVEYDIVADRYHFKTYPGSIDKDPDGDKWWLTAPRARNVRFTHD